MPVRYTHFFDGSRISRAQLKADPAFDGFSLFRRANQQNPFPLTVEQWEVIWAAVPAGSDLSAPKREFAVVLGMETSEADPRSAARDLERCFADRAWERLEDDVYEVGVDMDESAEVAESDQVSTRPDPMVVPPDAPFVIGWECLVYATSEADALRRVYADLYADIAQFGAGEFTLYPVSGG